MFKLSREAARAVVDSIAQASYEAPGLDTLKENLQVDLRADGERIVYELIQNAEDNQYYHAFAEKRDPLLKFTIYPDKVVIDSNEDGFTAEDVRALCETGNSTKQSLLGCGGRHGIGFHSVFAISPKVYIQSDPFSFSLTRLRPPRKLFHVLCPQNEDCQPLPASIQTRITLMLPNSGVSGSDMWSKIYRGVPDSLIFLEKIRAITVSRFRTHSAQPSFEDIFSRSQHSDQILVHAESSGTSTPKRRFRVFRKTVHNVASDSAHQRKGSANTTLAFPLDEEMELATTLGYVFAPLPISMTPFKFHVCSDFFVELDHQHLVHSSWNHALIRSIAELFRDAVLEFVQDPKTRYTWIEHIPVPEYWRNDIWIPAMNRIRRLLMETSVLEASSASELCVPSSLTWIPDWFNDANGKPLFPEWFRGPVENAPDPEFGFAVSKKYPAKHWMQLKWLGVTELTWDLVIRRISELLTDKQQNRRLDSEWHTRMATLVSRLFESDPPTHDHAFNMTQIRSLPAIPLQSGEWTAAVGREIFQSDPDGGQVPRDLGLNLIEAAASEDGNRREFFKHMGARDLKPDKVIRLIRDRYSKALQNIGSDLRMNITLEQSIAHFQYLFLNLPDSVEGFDGPMIFFDQHMCQVSLSVSPEGRRSFVFAKDPSGLSQHLSATKEPHYSKHTVSIHEDYWNKGAVVEHGQRRWRDWMEKITKTFSVPPLLEPSGSGLSRDFQAMLQNNPGDFLRRLKKHRQHYEPFFCKVEKELRESLVPCETGYRSRLGETFLPTPKLKALAIQLKLRTFPFLKIPDDSKNANVADWDFLKRLGVRMDDDLDFHLAALDSIVRDDDGNEVPPGLFNTYANIQRRIRGTASKHRISARFAKRNLIYISATATQASQWVSSETCLWEGSPLLQTKHSLCNDRNYEGLELLFHHTVGVRNVKWHDYIQELLRIKKEAAVAEEVAAKIYASMATYRTSDDRKLIRSSFEVYGLIYVPSDQAWHSPSSCVWAENAFLSRRRLGIADDYPDMKFFFNEVLGVEEPDVSVYVHELKYAADLNLSARHIKDLIEEIDSLTIPDGALRGLHDARIFPVKTPSGEVKLMRANEEFVILERSEHEEEFRSKTSSLDFSVEKYRKLSNFFRSLFRDVDMSARRSSTLVAQESQLGLMDGACHPGLTIDLRRKAYALFCCYVDASAKNMLPPPDESWYHRLKDATVYISLSIWQRMVLCQAGKTHVSNRRRGMVHLDLQSQKLKIYVPDDLEDREVCYMRHLPRRLCSLLKISSPETETAIGHILTSTNLNTVAKILEDADIDDRINGISPPTEFTTPSSRIRVDSALDSSMSEKVSPMTVTIKLPGSRTKAWKYMSVLRDLHPSEHRPSIKREPINMQSSPNSHPATAARDLPIRTPGSEKRKFDQLGGPYARHEADRSGMYYEVPPEYVGD